MSNSLRWAFYLSDGWARAQRLAWMPGRVVRIHRRRATVFGDESLNIPLGVLSREGEVSREIHKPGDRSRTKKL